MEQQTQHTPKIQTPLLLKILCYFIIIKTGVKILLSFIFFISGGHIEALKKSIGFDTLDNGGVPLQFFLILCGSLHIYAATQLLQLKRLGFYMHLVLTLVLFFAPAFFAPETYQYTASRIGFLLPMLVLPGIYFSRMK